MSRAVQNQREVDEPKSDRRADRIHFRGPGWRAEVVAFSGALKEGAGRIDASAWRDWIEQVLAEPSQLPRFQLLKYSPSVEVFRVGMDTGRSGAPFDLICKRSPIAGILDRFRASRARRNFDRGRRLVDAEVNTATPRAVVHRQRPTRESILVTDFVADLVDLDRVALVELPRLPRQKAAAVKRALTALVADLFAKLQAAGLHHRDLKASNIMFTSWNNPDAACLYLVDLDGLGNASRVRVSQRWRPLTRLAASLEGYHAITRTDFARGLRQYLVQTQQDDGDWKRQFARLAKHAQQYARTSKRRKQGKLDGLVG